MHSQGRKLGEIWERDPTRLGSPSFHKPLPSPPLPSPYQGPDNLTRGGGGDGVMRGDEGSIILRKSPKMLEISFRTEGVPLRDS
ncbi:hypothetical protein CCP4SC76_1890018 [Gammaproteobacteria bacterium]